MGVDPWSVGGWMGVEMVGGCVDGSVDQWSVGQVKWVTIE